MLTIILKFIILMIIISSSSAYNRNLQDNNSGIFRSKSDAINNLDKNIILSHFDKINSTLNSLKTIFTLHSDKCTLSYDKLQQLEDAIDDALTKDDQTSAINCNVNVNNPDGSCNELIKMIQCGIADMTDAIDNAIDDNAKLVQLQIQYELLQQQYQQFIDDNANYISQAAQKQIDDLKTKLQELQEFLNKVLNKLMQEVIDLVTDKIQLNEISEAAYDFNDVLDYKLDYTFIIESIVGRIYNNDLIDNLINFLRLLPAEAYSNPGYNKLIDLMTENDKLSSVNLFKYYEMAAPDGNHTERMQTFKNKLSDIYFEKIKKFASNLVNQNVNDINEALEKLTLRTYFADDIVIEAYTNVNYFDDMFSSVLKIEPLFDGSCMVFSAIFDAMQENNLMDDPKTLVYGRYIDGVSFTYEPMPEKPNEIILYQNCHNRLNKNKKNLPKSVREIIWYGDKCRITTVNGMLYADDQHAVNVKKFADPFDDHALWQIHSPFNAEYFEITNIHYKEKLAVDGESNKAFTGGNIEREQGYWVLHPRNDGSVYKITNKKYENNDLIVNLNRVNEASSDDGYKWKISCV